MTAGRPSAAVGRLVALEGVDGCGKTTQARLLAESLGALLTREPGGTDAGRRIREIVLHGDDGGRDGLSARAEALLVAADRAQHVHEVVEPALAAGRWVVTDRYSGSTFAYQGWGRGLAIDELRTLVAWAAGDRKPDLNVLVDVPLEVARRRMAGGRMDRLERSDPEFHQRVRDGFLSEASADPGRWVVVDGTAEIGVVADRVAGAVRERLGCPEGARS